MEVNTLRECGIVGRYLEKRKRLRIVFRGNVFIYGVGGESRKIRGERWIVEKWVGFCFMIYFRF